MPALNIYIDPEQMREVTRILKGIGRESTPTLVKSINGTIISTKAKMVKITGQRYALKASRIKQDYYERKANKNDLTAYVRTIGNPIGLYNYNPGKLTSKGASWKVMRRGPRTKYRPAFYADLPAPHVVMRRNYDKFNTGNVPNPAINYAGLPYKYRFKIDVKYGPAHQNALTRPGVMAGLELFAADRVSKLLDSNVKFLLSKAV